MTIAWVTVEDAVHDWVVSATGLANANVIPINDNGPRPDGAYVDYGFELERLGRDWLNVEDAAVPSSGAEIDQKARGMRRMTLRLRCFGGDATGAASSRAILENVVAKSILPSISDALVTAGIGISEFSTVTNITGIHNSTRLEPRAMLNVTAFLASEVSETGSYFSDVEVTNEVSDPDSTYTVEGGI